jgi:hypothetical protein
VEKDYAYIFLERPEKRESRGLRWKYWRTQRYEQYRALPFPQNPHNRERCSQSTAEHPSLCKGFVFA